MIDATIVSTMITATATIICGYLTYQTNRNEKARKEDSERVEARAKKRAEEGKLQLQMIHANTELTIGVAMALKTGHCNGEVESGLEQVKKANDAYDKFLNDIAIEQLKGE